MTTYLHLNILTDRSSLIRVYIVSLSVFVRHIMHYGIVKQIFYLEFFKYGVKTEYIFGNYRINLH